MLKRLTRATRPQEKRSASLAELIARYGAGEPGEAATPPNYTGNVIAFRAVRMVAEAAASVPLSVHEGSEVLEDGNLVRLLASPNPDQSGAELLEEVYGYLQTHGNAYLEKLDNEEETRALFLLHPDDITTTEQGYRHRSGRGERLIAPDLTGRMPLLHLAMWQPGKTRQGYAPLQAARSAIQLHNAANGWNRQLLQNAARPSGALIHRGGEGGHHLTPEQFDRLKVELEEGFTGMRGAGRPLLLDGGLDWRPMGMTPAEMDFQNLKDSAAREIALAFGVPPMLLGIPGDNTYANYREANLAFWRQTVLPLVRKVSGAMAGWMDDGRRVRIEPELDRIPALATERQQHLTLVAESDVLTTAEKRRALGYPAEPESCS